MSRVSFQDDEVHEAEFVVEKQDGTDIVRITIDYNDGKGHGLDITRKEAEILYYLLGFYY